MNINPGTCVVITGASSGIGKATALEFARKKAWLMLCSRSRSQLEEVSTECQKLGARTLVFPLDVSNESQVRECADKAVLIFGKIDVWVNNAAVSMFGKLEEVPSDAMRRVIETNLFGYINGCRAAIPFMREQGKGVIINISSIAGITSQPFTSGYCLTKSAINTLSSCLRMELRDTPGIKISTLVLPSVDTPMFQHAANFTGRSVQAMAPVYAPEKVARIIVKLAQRPMPEAVMGAAANIAMAARRLMPFLSEPVMGALVNRSHFKKERTGKTTGNLFRPMEKEEKIHGGWIGRARVKAAMGASNNIRSREKITGHKV